MTEREPQGGMSRIQVRLPMAGRISFWAQSFLGVTAAASWLISIVVGQARYGDQPTGTVLASWATLLTLISLGINIFFTWQYKQRSQLAGASPKEILSKLQLVIYISLAGTLLAVISLEAQVGELLSRVFLLRVYGGPDELLGLLLVIANTNIILAHFINLSSMLWVSGLLDRGQSRAEY